MLSGRFVIPFSSLLLICLFLFLLENANAALTITSGRGEPFVNAKQTGFYDLIVKNMFQRVGVEVRTVTLPSERSLINANTGVDDGNIARIKGIEKKYKNLLMVPGKIIDFDFVAFTKNRQFEVVGWEGLKPYNVAFINGWKAFEKKVKHYNRVDIVLYDLWSGVWWTRQHADDIHYLQPPIASYELYLYINKKHKKLLSGLSRALRSMKEDGTYQRIYDETLNKLLK